MHSSQLLQVLILSADHRAVAVLRSCAAGLGATVAHRSAPASFGPAPYRVVFLDADLAGMEPDQIQLWQKGPAPAPAVAWITGEPRSEESERAWRAGAGAVFSRPLWAPEVRAFLRRRLGPIRDAADAPAPKTCETATDIDLQILLDVQRELIPLQVPTEITSRLRTGLQRLFPGARTEVAVFSGTTAPTGESGCRVTPDDLDAWSAAVLPLRADDTLLGELRVDAGDGATFTRPKLQLLEAFAHQAAQGLHRTLLYEALSRGKTEWERTFDTIPDAIAILDPERRVRRVNLALADSLGLTPREVVGRICHEVLCGSDDACDECPVQKAIQSGRAVHWDAQVRRNGRIYEYSAYPLRDASGLQQGVITYGRDVTVEDQLAQGLRHSDKLVTLGQLAAGIAHEINNPLTAVSSYAQLLALRLEDPKSIESSRRIQQGIDRIHRLVQNLMSFARPTDDTFYPLNLNEIVTKTLSFSRYEVTRDETRLTEELQPHLPRILGSETQLEQLLVNLLTNARDAVGGRGTICVATGANGQEVWLEVVDDGIGIAEAELDKIFEPFYTTKPVGKGTGLGLFMALGIAKKHKGSLTLDSRPGSGTRARLILPVFSS